MGSRLGDDSVLEDEDPVRVPYGRDPVRDQDRRPSLPVLRRASSRAASVILSTLENASSRIRISGSAKQRAREGDALALPPRERDAAFSDERIEPLRESSRDRSSGGRARRRGEDHPLVASGLPTSRFVAQRTRRRGTTPAARRPRAQRGPMRLASARIDPVEQRRPPSVASRRRGTSEMRVHLPLPVRPTIATVVPREIVSSIPHRTSGAVRAEAESDTVEADRAGQAGEFTGSAGDAMSR